MNSTIVTVIQGPMERDILRAFFEKPLGSEVEFLAESAPIGSVAAGRENRFRCTVHLVARNFEDPDKLFVVGMTDDWETPAKPQVDLLPATRTTFKMQYDLRTGKGRMLMGISGGTTGQVDNYYSIFSLLHVH